MILTELNGVLQIIVIIRLSIFLHSVDLILEIGPDAVLATMAHGFQLVVDIDHHLLAVLDLILLLVLNV